VIEDPVHAQRRRERQRRKPRGRWPTLAVVLGLALVFAFGIALGEALHDNPKPGGSHTIERTFTVVQVTPLKP
jgi:hypothetical protein